MSFIRITMPKNSLMRGTRFPLSLGIRVTTSGSDATERWASCARCSASSCVVCCTRDTDEDAHARRCWNNLNELETSRRVQRAILLLGTLLPP